MNYLHSFLNVNMCMSSSKLAKKILYYSDRRSKQIYAFENWSNNKCTEFFGKNNLLVVCCSIFNVKTKKCYNKKYNF